MTRESLWNQKPSCLSLQVGEKVLWYVYREAWHWTLLASELWGWMQGWGLLGGTWELYCPCALPMGSPLCLLYCFFVAWLCNCRWCRNKRAVKYYSATTKMAPALTLIILAEPACLSHVWCVIQFKLFCHCWLQESDRFRVLRERRWVLIAHQSYKLPDVCWPYAPQEWLRLEPHDFMWQMTNHF